MASFGAGQEIGHNQNTSIKRIETGVSPLPPTSRSRSRHNQNTSIKRIETRDASTPAPNTLLCHNQNTSIKRIETSQVCGGDLHDDASQSEHLYKED